MNKKSNTTALLKTFYRILGPVIKNRRKLVWIRHGKKKEKSQKQKKHKLSCLKIYASHKGILDSRVQTTGQIFHISTFMKLRHELQI
jgi:hypothetical protein